MFTRKLAALLIPLAFLTTACDTSDNTAQLEACQDALESSQVIISGLLLALNESADFKPQKAIVYLELVQAEIDVWEENSASCQSE